jgi:hypothetical protein
VIVAASRRSSLALKVAWCVRPDVNLTFDGFPDEPGVEVGRLPGFEP